MEKKLPKFFIPLAIIIFGILVGGAILYPKTNLKNLPLVKKENFLSPSEAAQKAIDYINKNLLQPGNEASLVEVQEESGLYKFKLKIAGREYNSYVTKDGKLLFPSEGIDLDQKRETPASSPQKKMSCEDIKKEKKPLLEAFVVSRCPFGTQMQRVLGEIIKNVPSLAENIRVEYIGAVENGKITSMHGEEEAKENLNQICLREEQKEKYWPYLSCYLKKGESEKCLKEAQVDMEKLKGCLEDNSRGLSYAKKDFELQEKYGVGGSPTLILNGQEVSEYDFGGRSAEAVKTLLCCGFEEKPEFCNRKLNENQAATGFSESYSQSSGAGAGSCQ